MKTIFTKKEIAAIDGIFAELNEGIKEAGTILDENIPTEPMTYLESLKKRQHITITTLDDGSLVIESPEEMITDLYKLSGICLRTYMVSTAMFIKPWMGLKDMVMNFYRKWVEVRDPLKEEHDRIIAEMRKAYN